MQVWLPFESPVLEGDMDKELWWLLWRNAVKNDDGINPLSVDIAESVVKKMSLLQMLAVVDVQLRM